MGDDLVWMDLTSLAEEKYPDPKKRWIEIQESTLNFVLVCMQLEYEKAIDTSYKFELFKIIEELKSQQK